MSSSQKLPGNGKLLLKKRTNWFAAGEEFLKAMELLDDGAFKLFSFLCLKADRLTATYRGSSDQLAFALRKPRPVIESCLAELKAKGVCTAADTAAGFGGTLRIEDEFWPYHPPTNVSTAQCTNGYIAAIRQQFLALGCTTGRFGASEEAQARSLERRGVPLEIVRDAMIMAACRKYLSWLNNGYSEPICSIAYFESVIAEFLRCPPPPDYRNNLPFELKRLANHWARGVQTRQKQLPNPRDAQPDQQSHGKIRDDVEEVY